MRTEEREVHNPIRLPPPLSSDVRAGEGDEMIRGDRDKRDDEGTIHHLTDEIE